MRLFFKERFPFFLPLLCGLLSLGTVIWPEEFPPLPKGPLLLTSVRPEMLKADYWANRLPDPDRVLKTPEELKELNEEIHAMVKDRVDLFKWDLVRPGAPIREQLELEYNTLEGRVLYDANDRFIPKGLFREQIKPQMQIDKVPGRIPLRWGAATQETSVRALPSDVKMLEKKGDIEFDQLQFTLIKLWTPVAVLHESRNGRWFYIQAPYIRGWVKAKDTALFADRTQLKKYVKSESFLVVTGEAVPLYADPGLPQVFERPSMGTILPLAEKNEKAYAVWMPRRRGQNGVLLFKAYVWSESDVSVGFPSFTQRHILQQAFKLLGARYGWGGTYGGRDCSGFTHDVFLSMGVDMPRGSRDQAFAGTQINHFEPFKQAEEKMAAVRSAVPGITLLRMPLHQMIYLGEAGGQYYVIHSTWAERISRTSDEKNRINQIVVSDLTLNGNSYLGSLFDRIISISEVN